MGNTQAFSQPLALPINQGAREKKQQAVGAASSTVHSNFSGVYRLREAVTSGFTYYVAKRRTIRSGLQQVWQPRRLLHYVSLFVYVRRRNPCKYEVVNDNNTRITLWLRSRFLIEILQEFLHNLHHCNSKCFLYLRDRLFSSLRSLHNAVVPASGLDEIPHCIVRC